MPKGRVHTLKRAEGPDESKTKSRKKKPQRGLMGRGGEMAGRAGKCMHKRERGFRKG